MPIPPDCCARASHIHSTSLLSSDAWEAGGVCEGWGVGVEVQSGGEQVRMGRLVLIAGIA
jgi:hypothetical protein